MEGLGVSCVLADVPQEHGYYRCVWKTVELELREGPELRSCVRGEMTVWPVFTGHFVRLCGQ